MTLADDDHRGGYRLTGTLPDGKQVILLQQAPREMTEYVAKLLSRRMAFHDLRIDPDVGDSPNVPVVRENFASTRQS